MDEINQAPVYSEFERQVPDASQPEQQVPDNSQPEQQTDNPKKKVNGIKILIICIAVFVVLLIAAAIPLTIYAVKSAHYNDAVSLMETGKYTEALEEFDSLGKFKDSEQNAEYCKNGITYDEAQGLFDSGDYEAAKEKFSQTNNFLDSAEKIEDCLDHIAYNNALTLIKNGNYEQAKELLEPLDSNTFSDRDELITECTNRPLYNDAKKAFDDELYYTAYKLFRKLGKYLDSEDMVSLCKQDLPESGVLYMNKDFKSSATIIEFKAGKYHGNGTYIKIYDKNETLVASLFVRAKSKCKLRLAAGKYKINISNSYGSWFGEKEKFGADGIYYKSMENDSDLLTFKRNYITTFYLGFDEEDGNIPGHSIDSDWVNRNDF